MIMAKRCDIEMHEEDFHDAQENGQQDITEVMELSLHSFSGWSTPTKTKIRGTIWKLSVIVIINSGATNSFMSPLIIKKHLPDYNNKFIVTTDVLCVDCRGTRRDLYTTHEHVGVQKNFCTTLILAYVSTSRDLCTTYELHKYKEGFWYYIAMYTKGIWMCGEGLLYPHILCVYTSLYMRRT